MSKSQPRLTVAVERPLYEAIENLAKRDHMSLSRKVRDLLVGALSLIEDDQLEERVEKRRKVSKKTHSLAQTKKSFSIK